MTGFWIIHNGLSREGPGTPEDVAWAAEVAQLPKTGRVCDVGCGPGSDLGVLADRVPQGHVIGLDPYLSFVVEATLRHWDRPEIRVRRGSSLGGDGLMAPSDVGPLDLIWCAGAIYFDGVGPSLTSWRSALAPGGSVVFSAPVVAQADDAEAVAFWEGEAFDTDDSLDAKIRDAGYEVTARSRVSDAGWQAYFDAVEARCDALDGVDDPELQNAITQSRQEAETWSRLKDRLGYALRVVRPI
ncbi:ubiquinone/menaquinone biosynthesis methyltransferase [Jannaschia sp. AI_61]|nr:MULTISPECIES: class I SAM-dependent methyltransferase [unclassified Jannaschia]GIT92130.1 ubiquinone/menaquinone biosynthesis methyltransferase [Jannaschia sp. AI_61]